MPDMSATEDPSDSGGPGTKQAPEGGGGGPGRTQANSGDQLTVGGRGATPPGLSQTSEQPTRGHLANAKHTNHHGNGDAQLVEARGEGAKVSVMSPQQGETEGRTRKSVTSVKKRSNLQMRNNSPGKTSSVISIDIKKSTYMSEVKTSDVGPSDSASNLRHKQKEPSFLQTVKKEAKKAESSMPGHSLLKQSRKKMKKGIFISYSPDAGFQERKFVVETTRQLKENNLAEDIWFDKDENNTDSPCWFSFRMEAVERCRAALLFLSDSYFSCPVSMYEGKTLLERHKEDPNSVKIFIVIYSMSAETEIPKGYQHVLQDVVDLSTNEHAKKSIAEKTSVVIGHLMMELEKYASIHTPPIPCNPPDSEFTGQYKLKRISKWQPNDLQEWLFKLGIKEFYRQSLAETMVDGFLLMSMTDSDMMLHLGIDSRVTRKKIMQQILLTLDREHKISENWHLQARTQRARPHSLYLIYDPTDVRLAQNLKQDLSRKGLQVIHHHKLGQSKEEFLQLNGPQMAMATFVLIVMTEGAVSSPFVFHEVMFADWLGKKLITAVFKNTWSTLRASLRAVLGDCPSVDFETRMYAESMEVLEHHIKPQRTVPGVILEQAYLNKMQEGIKPLSTLATTRVSGMVSEHALGGGESRVFISYQWDMQSRVEEIRGILEVNGLVCWADISPTMGPGMPRGNSGLSTRTSVVAIDNETLQSHIQRNMKAAGIVICCITPKYMNSDNCIKDLTLAESLHKAIIPVLLRFCPWPPEGAPLPIRKILVKHAPVDLSNEKLFKQNMHVLLDRIKKYFSV